MSPNWSTVLSSIRYSCWAALSIQYQYVQNWSDNHKTTGHVLQSKDTNVSNIAISLLPSNREKKQRRKKLLNQLTKCFVLHDLSLSDCGITPREFKYDYLKSTAHGKNWRRYYAKMLFKVTAQTHIHWRMLVFYLKYFHFLCKHFEVLHTIEDSLTV